MRPNNIGCMNTTYPTEQREAKKSNREEKEKFEKIFSNFEKRKRKGFHFSRFERRKRNFLNDSPLSRRERERDFIFSRFERRTRNSPCQAFYTLKALLCKDFKHTSQSQYQRGSGSCTADNLLLSNFVSSLLIGRKPSELPLVDCQTKPNQTLSIT